jgi:prepilin-type N-terminal cleavage/methylation domain-containing protein
MKQNMPRQSRSHEPRRPNSGGGVTLIELIVVMVMIAILAASAVPSLASMASSRAAAGSKQVLRDVSFAREWAILTGTRTWVVFSPNSESYSVLAEDPSNPGRVNATVVTDPATGMPYNIVLGSASAEFTGVEIVSASFDGAAEIGFDWLGQPLNNAETALAAQGVVTMNSGHTITVRVGTGLVSFVAP